MPGHLRAADPSTLETGGSFDHFSLSKSGHRSARVPRAGRRIFRHGAFDGRQVFRGKCDLERSERFGELIPAPRADERNDVRALLGDPGDGDLGVRLLRLARAQRTVEVGRVTEPAVRE